MSIDCESNSLPDGSIYIPLRHRARPAFTTTEEAISYVGEVLAEIGPWPEVVEVKEAAALEGRLQVISVSDHDLVAEKAHVIGATVRRHLGFLEMAVRMPQLALVVGDYAELLFDTRTYRVLSDDYLAASGALRESILGLLPEAGDRGVTTSDLYDRFAGTPQDDAVRAIARTSFMAQLRRLKADGLAEISPAGGWRLTRQEGGRRDGDLG